jgi:Polyketide synthase dehydratase
VVTSPLDVHIVLEMQGDGRIGYELYSEDEASGQDRVYCQGYVQRNIAAPAEVLDLAGLRAACTEEADLEAMYVRLAGQGIIYGPDLRVHRHICHSADTVIAQIEPTVCSDELLRWYPALLDATARHTRENLQW